MYRQYIRGRDRILDPEKKSKLCRMVAESATIEQAAETLDVSLRTVQRERKGDEDFDHVLRLALQATPDVRKLMESAARTHWRAAAWLLERTEPETYARKPANTAYAAQVTAALEAVVEAALEAVPPELRQEVYRHVHAASERTFDCCFPNLGPWGNPRNPKHPPTPLTDAAFSVRWSDPSEYVHILDDDENKPPLSREESDRRLQAYVIRKESAPTPARAAAQAAVAQHDRQRCKTQPCQKVEIENDKPAAPAPPAPPDPNPRLSWRFNLRATQSTTTPEEFPRRDEVDGEVEVNDGILSPKMRLATEFDPDDIPSEQTEATPPRKMGEFLTTKHTKGYERGNTGSQGTLGNGAPTPG